MKFDEIVSRITGFSVPIFGLSWNPSESQRTIARNVITYLEDRRVLYNPYSFEDPKDCVNSVIEIRKFLTEKISNLGNDSELGNNLRSMRAACRKFLDTNNYHDSKSFSSRHYDGYYFQDALGELRGVFGIHLAIIAAKYGLDIEDSLESILPSRDDLDNGSLQEK